MEDVTVLEIMRRHKRLHVLCTALAAEHRKKNSGSQSFLAFVTFQHAIYISTSAAAIVVLIIRPC